jgi:hypothetical protein
MPGPETGALTRFESLWETFSRRQARTCTQAALAVPAAYLPVAIRLQEYKFWILQHNGESSVFFWWGIS